jgi:catechol 2,3-dioxygenase-like lactoylglutathione lyase family enzyme
MDRQGLMLLVKASGARSWVLRYQIKGRRRDMGLGAWPEISLAKARERAMDVRRGIALGQDPMTIAPERKKLTFQEVAEALIAAKRDGWRNAKHAAQWTSTLARYVFPALGRLEVQTITTENILAVLTPIWTEKPETASRVRCMSEATVNVRYMVDDVETAIEWYIKHLGFSLLSKHVPAFADVKRGSLRLLLSGSSSSAGRPMPDGEQPRPGGWNRIHLIVDDLPAEVARLRAAGVRFRNEIVTGPGGSQILLLDPAGNLVELFQPGRL